MFRAVKMWDEKWKILFQILTKILLFAQSKTLHKYQVKMQKSSIYEKILCLFSKARKFLEFSYFLKNQEAGENPPDRPSQNTLKLFLSFNVLSSHHKCNGTIFLSPQIEFIQVFSQIVERRKVQENLKISYRQSPLQKQKFVTGSRKLNKINFSTFHESPTLLDFINQSQSTL